MNGWTSRKFWIAMGTAALTTVLLIYGFIDQETWKWVMSATVISYMGANVAEKKLVTNGT